MSLPFNPPPSQGSLAAPTRPLSTSPAVGSGSSVTSSPIATVVTVGKESVRLWDNAAERDQHENYASLFVIIRATEALEKAYTKDIISNNEYKTECAKLIAQFRRAVKLAGVGDVSSWMEQQGLRAQAAYHRLVESGVVDTGEDISPKIIADTTGLFVTIQDAIKLSYLAVDALQPHVYDLYDKLSQYGGLPPDSAAKGKVKKWLRTFESMKASDQLDEEQARQMLFDISSAQDAFYKSLSGATN